MANHLHKQIRDALVTALTGLATTGANVFGSRRAVIGEGQLPALRIWFDGERAEPVSIHPNHLQERVPGVAVEACAKDIVGTEDDLDQIAKEVEIALSAGITVAGKSLAVYYRGIDALDDDPQVNKPVAVKTMRFEIPYVSPSNAPDTLAL